MTSFRVSSYSFKRGINPWKKALLGTKVEYEISWVDTSSFLRLLRKTEAVFKMKKYRSTLIWPTPKRVYFLCYLKELTVGKNLVFISPRRFLLTIRKGFFCKKYLASREENFSDWLIALLLGKAPQKVFPPSRYLELNHFWSKQSQKSRQESEVSFIGKEFSWGIGLLLRSPWTSGKINGTSILRMSPTASTHTIDTVKKASRDALPHDFKWNREKEQLMSQQIWERLIILNSLWLGSN